jgi:hypothetical protein
VSRERARCRSSARCARSSRIASGRSRRRSRTSSRCSRRASSSARPGRARCRSAAGASPSRRSTLDAERAKRLKEQIPRRLYEPGKSQFSLRVPDAPEERFPAVSMRQMPFWRSPVRRP